MKISNIMSEFTREVDAWCQGVNVIIDKCYCVFAVKPQTRSIKRDRYNETLKKKIREIADRVGNYVLFAKYLPGEKMSVLACQGKLAPFVWWSYRMFAGFCNSHRPHRISFLVTKEIHWVILSRSLRQDSHFPRSQEGIVVNLSPW